jgi:ABC-2 type transport system ATP-binding protein
MMLELRNLTKRYGERVAVDRLSLSVNRGERFGLLGPNGAGKTTTISMLVGALKPDSGEILFGGEPLAGESDPLKRKIGYVPQELALYDELTATDNLRFFGAVYGLGGAKLAERVEASLEVAGLTDRAKNRVKTFSGGMKRRLNLAAALLHEPELLVLDEPTVGVDPQSRNAIFEALERLAQSGLTLLYTTHYMEEVERLCDRIAIMDQGQIVAEGTQAELSELLPKSPRRAITLDADEATLALLATHQLSWREASERGGLESVFLHLTGRSLRDE